MKNKVRQLLVIFTLLITVLGACTAPSNSDRVTENQPERVFKLLYHTALDRYQPAECR